MNFRSLHVRRRQTVIWLSKSFVIESPFIESTLTYCLKGRHVFYNLNFSIRANSLAVFVGEFGVGKTILVATFTLMLRPISGDIIIDGLPHEEINTYSWRKCIGYVSQDMVVIDDTIANNVTLRKGDGNTDPETRQLIEESAEKAYTRTFIEMFKQGFNRMVGERCIRLSGEKQRLTLAREQFNKPDPLALDEATSA